MCDTVRLSVCLGVRAVEGKRLELSKANPLQTWSIAVATCAKKIMSMVKVT